MKVKFKYDRSHFLAVLVALAQIQWTRCDLYIFAKDKEMLEMNKQHQKDDMAYRPAFDSSRGLDSRDDKLYLFPDAKSCMDQMDFDAYFKSTGDKGKFCSQYCSDHEFAFRPTTTASPYIVEYTSSSSSSLGSDTEEGGKRELSPSGILHYYRSFIHVFLENLKHEQTSEENPNFKVNIELSRLQIAKLQRFSESVNETDAAGLIQEATYILKNMLKNVDHFRPETFMDNVKGVFSFNLVQYAFLILSVVTSSVVMILHHFGYKRFTWKNLIVTLVFVAFVSSVFNNHIILNQKKQILRQQKLKEIIPDECFLNSNEQQHAAHQSKGGFTKAVYQVFKKYLGHSPTSKSCLEYQEALFINSYQSNIAETIMYTFFESIRPVAISFGDFINQFHVALVKDLSFYQAIPLLVLVTIILVPVLLYLMSFLFLVLFNYEFNFFHLISFKKSASQSKADKQQLNEINAIKSALKSQKEEMIKALRMIQQENEKIARKHEAVTAAAASVESLACLTYPKEKSMSPTKPPSGAQVYTEIPKLNTSEYDDGDEEEDELNLSTVNDMLNRTFDSLFENLAKKSQKEDENVEIINQLLEENKRLKAQATTTQTMVVGKQQQSLPFPLPPQQFKSQQYDMNHVTGLYPNSSSNQNNNTRASSHSPPTATQKGSAASPASHHRKPANRQAVVVAPNQSPPTPTKIISIGHSKTVRPLINELSSQAPSSAHSDDKYSNLNDPAAPRRVRKAPMDIMLTDSIESSTERIFRNGDQNESSDAKSSSNQSSPSNPTTSYRTSLLNHHPHHDQAAADTEEDDEDIYVILEDK